MFSWVQLSHIVDWSKGSLRVPTSQDFHIREICTDSRELKKGQAFAAIRGQTFDGHRFLKNAVERGASMLISEEPFEADIPVLVVKDTVHALANIAAKLRSHFHAPVAAITGSAGKSSTKDAVGTLLGPNALRSPASFNNLIGMSRTWFLIQEFMDCVVLEMGMNALGEIKELCEYARPEAGLITNIGDAHIGKLGGKEGIYKAKKELFDFLAQAGGKTRGVALNIDDPLVVRALAESGVKSGKVVNYSASGKDADVKITHKTIDPDSGFLKVTLNFFAETWQFHLPIFGLHHAENLAAGLAMAAVLGKSASALKGRVPHVRPAYHRGEIHELSNGVTLIDESYNSNPTALLSSLTSLSRLNPKRRKILVLGEMRELGEFSADLHRKVGGEIGRLFANTPFQVIAVGSEVKHLIEPLKSQGGASMIGNVSEAKAVVSAELKPGDFCLVKGSRGIQLDLLVEHLKEQWGAKSS